MHMLFTESIVLFISIYVAFNFGVLFTFIAAFPYIFKTLYHFTTEQAGLVFLAFGVGSLLSVPTVMLCDHFFYKRQHRRVHVDGGREGNIAPEYRLYPAMLGSVGIRTLPSASIIFLIVARLLTTLFSDQPLLVRLDSEK
jgi:hypothetical protein